jgi:hypothetical protein
MKELAVVYGVSKNTITHAIQEQNYKRFDRADSPSVPKSIQSVRSRNFKTGEG